MVMDVSVSFVPLLIVILLVVVVSRVDSEVLGNPGRQFDLFIDFVKEQIVFFGHHAVTVGTVLGKDLKTYISYE